MINHFTFEFSKCADLNAARALYRQLSKQWHPDLGGCTEAMKFLNLAYESWTAGSCTHEEHVTEQALAKALQAVLSLGLPESVTVELIGSWIWIGGDSKPFKDQLKELGYKWHCKRKLWFWTSAKSVRTYNKKADITELKFKYGCRSFSSRGAVAV